MNVDQVRKYQLSQLELLDYVDKVCQELGIHYYMIGGTLLGAVRHNGFIPWDPDTDIAMKRDDYEKFRLYCKEHISSRYFYQHYTTEKHHLSPHAILRIKNTKVVSSEQRETSYHPQNEGIYLDIFPLDTPPADEKRQKKQMKRLARIKQVAVLKSAYIYGEKTGFAKRIVKKIIQVCLMPIPFSYVWKKLDREMRRYENEGAKYLVSMASHYSYWKQLMPADIYGCPQRLNFEEKSYLAPAQTEAYLKRIYGDYMKLPPEDQRFSGIDRIDHIDYGE